MLCLFLLQINRAIDLGAYGEDGNAHRNAIAQLERKNKYG